jgi:parallel beta-helix repeat protein
MPMKKTRQNAFLIFVIGGLVFFGSLRLDTAQTGVITIIGSDTTWTKTNSPYTLTGPIVVNEGITLTVEAGVTVNLNNYYLYLNGTLKAIGNPNDRIQFLGGEITFGSNPEGTSSTFEYAVINASVSSSRPLVLENNVVYRQVTAGDTSTFMYNIISGDIKAGSSTTISYNNITGAISVGDACVIFNNTIGGDTSTGKLSKVMNNIMQASVLSTNPSTALTVGASSEVKNNTITGGLAATSSTISNNTISGGFPFTDWSMVRVTDSTSAVMVDGNSTVASNTIFSTRGYGILVKEGYTKISGNTVSQGIRVAGDALIENNLIINSGTGIRVGEIYVPAFYEADYGNGDSVIRNNIITNCTTGIGSTQGGGTSKIERNLIANNINGILVNSEVTIQNNTLSNNTVGIELNKWTREIIFNNIVNNSQNGIVLKDVSKDVNSTYNWWGTTDMQTINFSIHDFKYNFNLGTVSFVPFLTETNLQATPTPEDALPTPLEPTNPTPTAITVSVSPPAAPMGTSVTITGTATGTKGMEIAVTTIDPNGNFQTIGNLPPQPDGSYKVSWIPPLEGTYTIIAALDATGVKATTNLTITHVESNSTPTATSTHSIGPSSTETPTQTTPPTPQTSPTAAANNQLTTQSTPQVSVAPETTQTGGQTEGQPPPSDATATVTIVVAVAAIVAVLMILAVMLKRTSPANAAS